MKTALIIIAVIAIGTLVIGGLTHRYWTPEKRAEFLAKIVTKKLDLNEEQQAKFNTLKEQILSARLEMRNKHEADFSTIKELLAQPKFDQQRANEMINGHIQDISSRTPEIVSAAGEFWDSLSPEQQAKLNAKLDKLHSCHKHRRFCC